MTFLWPAEALRKLHISQTLIQFLKLLIIHWTNTEDIINMLWLTSRITAKLGSVYQSLELLMEKKGGNFKGFWKVATKICAISGILEANLKKCSTQKIVTNISFVPSICLHRSIILIIIEKSMLLTFFPWKIHFSTIFNFPFRENPRFHDEIQALVYLFLQSYYVGHLPKPHHGLLAASSLMTPLNNNNRI